MQISMRGHDIQASPIRKLKPYADAAKAKGIKVYPPEHRRPRHPDAPARPRHLPAAIGSPSWATARPRASSSCGRPSPAISALRIPLQADNIIITTGGSEAIHFSFAVDRRRRRRDRHPGALLHELQRLRLLRRPQDRSPAAPGRGRLPPASARGHRIEDHPRRPGPSCSARRTIPRAPSTRPRSWSGSSDRQEARPLPDRRRGLQGIHLRRPEAQEHPRIRGHQGPGDRGRQHLQAVQLLRSPDRDDHHPQRRASTSRLCKFAQARLCPPSVEQKAAIAAYKMGHGLFRARPARNTQRRRDVLYEGLNGDPRRRRPQAPGRLLHHRPAAGQGRRTLRGLDAQSSSPLDGKTVMVAPAPGFYATPGQGPDEVRIAYVINEEDIREGPPASSRPAWKNTRPWTRRDR